MNNTQYQTYKLREIIDDFYDVLSVEFEPQENNKGGYNSDFLLEGDQTLRINSKLRGNFIITYKAYPEKITSSTLDTYEIPVPSEALILLPLYIASELYKDDDISTATIYRNQFEAGLETITPEDDQIEFADTSGWL